MTLNDDDRNVASANLSRLCGAMRSRIVSSTAKTLSRG